MDESLVEKVVRDIKPLLPGEVIGNIYSAAEVAIAVVALHNYQVASKRFRKDIKND